VASGGEVVDFESRVKGKDVKMSGDLPGNLKVSENLLQSS
jgi:hypothetical protein